MALLSEALTAAVKGKAAICLPNTPPESPILDQWPQPETSIGAPCKSLGVLVRYKCWLVKDKSPVALVWKNVSNQIRTYLEEQYEHLNAGDSTLRIEIFMIGRKPDKSSPTILFSCKNGKCRRLAIDLVHRKGFLACYPGILMAGCSRHPQQMAIEELNTLRFPVGVYLNGPISGCGLSVLISYNQEAPPRKATIGGVVSLGNQYYGVTTAHAFQEPATATIDLDEEFAFYHLGEPDMGSDDEDYLIISSHEESISSRSVRSINFENPNGEGSSFVRDQSTETTHQPSGSTVALTIQRERKPIKVGSLFAFSTLKSQGSMDWALVRINPSFSSNIQGFLENRVRWGEHLAWPESVQRAVDTRVLICTGDKNVIEGRLSGVASFTKVPGKKKFQELWTVQRITGSFVDGDCGSWVVDLDTRDLFGHIVSGYPESGTAYVAPAEEVFHDIQRTVGKRVELSVFPGPSLLTSPSPETRASCVVPGEQAFRNIPQTVGMQAEISSFSEPPPTIGPMLRRPATAKKRRREMNRKDSDVFFNNQDVPSYSSSPTPPSHQAQQMTMMPPLILPSPSRKRRNLETMQDGDSATSGKGSLTGNNYGIDSTKGLIASPKAPPAKKTRTNTPWSPAEEQRLKSMRDAQSSWAEIAKTFPTRTEGSVKKHWYKDMHYAEFAEDESAALLNAIKEYETNKWKVIGQKVGKPAKACEQYAKEHFGNKM